MVCHFHTLQQGATDRNHRHTLLTQNLRIIYRERVFFYGTRIC